MKTRRRSSTTYALATILLVSLAGIVLGQVPFVPREFYEGRRHLDGDQIRFCVWAENPTATFDRSVGEQIAAALLLEADFHNIEGIIFDGDEFWEEVFLALADHCEAFLGFRFEPDALPDWLTISRSYYRASTVLAVADKNVDSLGDLPRDGFVGSRLYTQADYRLIAYMRALPADDRWRRLPYDSSQMLVNHVAAGTLDGAILWSPILYQLTGGDPEAHGIRVASTDPLQFPETAIGIAVRSRNTYLRSLLDEAIIALIEDGVIGEMIEEHGMPGHPGS